MTKVERGEAQPLSGEWREHVLHLATDTAVFEWGQNGGPGVRIRAERKLVYGSSSGRVQSAVFIDVGMSSDSSGQFYGPEFLRIAHAFDRAAQQLRRWYSEHGQVVCPIPEGAILGNE